jgi:hypothetical protein
VAQCGHEQTTTTPAPDDEDEEDVGDEDTAKNANEKQVWPTGDVLKDEIYLQLSNKRQRVEDTERMPDYDNATKALIEAAESARTKHREVDDKIRQISDDIRLAQLTLFLQSMPIQKCGTAHERECLWRRHGMGVVEGHMR